MATGIVCLYHNKLVFSQNAPKQNFTHGYCDTKSLYIKLCNKYMSTVVVTNSDQPLRGNSNPAKLRSSGNRESAVIDDVMSLRR